MITWSVSPILLELGPITLRWYGLLFATGFILGHKVTTRYFLNEKVPIHKVDQLLLYVAIGTILGARLGHTLFYEPEIYLRNPLRILSIWEGGLASHGAALGIFLAIYLYFRKNPELGLLWVFDRAAPAVAIAGVLIRLGNLFNSEILGRPSDVPWAFVFTRVDNVPRHPAMVYESIIYGISFVILERMYWNERFRRAPGLIFGSFLILIFGSRFFVEFFKEVQVAFEQSLPLDMGQLLSIPLVVLGVALVVRARKMMANPEFATAGAGGAAGGKKGRKGR